MSVKNIDVYYAIGSGETFLEGHGRKLPEGERHRPFDQIGTLLITRPGNYAFRSETFKTIESLESYLDDCNDGYTIEMMARLFESIANEV